MSTRLPRSRRGHACSERFQATGDRKPLHRPSSRKAAPRGTPSAAECLEGRFAAAMQRVGVAGALWPGAVAVSGGGDSVALMYLLAVWAKKSRVPPPHVVTVDHALRADS